MEVGFHHGVAVVEISWLLVCLAMEAFQAVPGVVALLGGADLVAEAAGAVLVKDGETVAGAAVAGITKTVDNNPVMVKDSVGEVIAAVKQLAGVVVELLSAEAALLLVGQNAPMDPRPRPRPRPRLVGTLALLSVQAVLHLVGQNAMDPLAVRPAVGVHLEVKAGEDLLQIVVVGLMDNKAGAVVELAGVHLLVEIGVLKVTLVLKAFTLKWPVKLFKPITQFLNGIMLTVVQPVLTLELKQKLTDPLLPLPTLKCPGHTTLVPFHETLRSLSSLFAVSLESSFWL